jgi:hypothetical protein
MSTATCREIIYELARMRTWRLVGDEREAERCNERINDLLDDIVSPMARRSGAHTSTS